MIANLRFRYNLKLLMIGSKQKIVTTSLFLPDDSNIAAVMIEIFGRRQDKLFAFKIEIGIFIEEFFYKLAVFLFLYAACAVADFPLRL